MRKNTIPVSMEAIEELLDRKLEEKLEQKLDEKFDEKLKPLHKDIGSIHNDIESIHNEIGSIHSDIGSIHAELAEIKDVVENRVYKELTETKKEMREGFARLEKITVAIVQDADDHDLRIKRLEKHTGIFGKN